MLQQHSLAYGSGRLFQGIFESWGTFRCSWERKLRVSRKLFTNECVGLETCTAGHLFAFVYNGIDVCMYLNVWFRTASERWPQVPHEWEFGQTSHSLSIERYQKMSQDQDLLQSTDHLLDKRHLALLGTNKQRSNNGVWQFDAGDSRGVHRPR